MQDLRIVIPALNEEEGIGSVIDDVVKACPEAEVVVVDDGSKDKTAAISQEKGVKVVSNTDHHGKGGATKFGFKVNSDRNIDYFGFIDADNTYTPEKFQDLYKLCKEEHVDMAIASRLSGKQYSMPFVRKLGNKLFAILLSFYTGRKTTDTTTGQRIINKNVLQAIDQFADGLDFDIGMTSYVLFNGLQYAEIPIRHVDRAGNSKMKVIQDGYRFLKVILIATRKYRPVLFYTTLGLPYLLIESLLSAYHRVNPST